MKEMIYCVENLSLHLMFSQIS